MTTRGPRLVLLGKQGAGKGTQASRLADHYGVAHLATGDMFRAAVRDGTPLGVEAQKYMDTGELVPDEIVVGVVEEEMARAGLVEKGFVLDGFPRTVKQAEELERVLDSHPLDVVIDLDVPTEIVLHRIAGRRVCEQCQTPFHVDNPPAENWTCDVCGGKVVQREDDNEDAVLRRLELWEIQTLPLIQFYRRRARLAHVNGDGDSELVYEALVRTVDDRLAAAGSMITRKSREQIALMRRAGRVVAEMHEECIRASKPGATTLEVDAVAREVLDRRGARSNFLNYHGFPAVVCTSPNDVIVHGIPSADVVLEEGDILSIDCGAIIEGWHADAAVTIPIGEVDDESKRPDRGHPRARSRRRSSRSSRVIGSATSAPPSRGSPRRPASPSCGSTSATASGRRCTRSPRSRTTGRPGGLRLKEGHVLAIEPMVNAGGPETEVLADGWTVRHPRRPPLRPFRAHHRRHRQRPRGPDPPLKRLRWSTITDGPFWGEDPGGGGGYVRKKGGWVRFWSATG